MLAIVKINIDEIIYFLNSMSKLIISRKSISSSLGSFALFLAISN